MWVKPKIYQSFAVESWLTKVKQFVIANKHFIDFAKKSCTDSRGMYRIMSYHTHSLHHVMKINPSIMK